MAPYDQSCLELYQAKLIEAEEKIEQLELDLKGSLCDISIQRMRDQQIRAMTEKKNYSGAIADIFAQSERQG